MIKQLSRTLSNALEKSLLQGAIRTFGSSNFHYKEAPILNEDKNLKDKKDEEEQTVYVDKDKNITLIGINRPQQRNAINSKTAAKLCEAFSAFEADDTSPIAVLYGIGGSFCSGFDILELGSEDETRVSVEMLMMPEGSVGPTRRILKKPVVCGINGYCVANGLELALMCDLRVMEDSAVLGFFNRRFGVPVLDGGTIRLPAMIGLSRALDLILTGRHICAEEAFQIGMVNRIVPNGQSLNEAIQLANSLAKFPQSALNHDRNSLYSAVFDSSNFQQAIQNEIMYTSRDIIDQMQDGIKWFNRTFKTEGITESWLKRDKSMADWYDEEVAEAAAKIETERQAKVVARIENEQNKQSEKNVKSKTDQALNKRSAESEETISKCTSNSTPTLQESKPKSTDTTPKKDDPK